MKKVLKITIGIVLVLVAVYFAGPSPDSPSYDPQLPTVPPIDQIEAYVNNIESQHKLKPGNEAQIIWNDSLRNKTPIAVVYLHGFSASHYEGGPVHVDFAKRYGCNLYLSRLAEHGIDTVDALYNYTPERAWESVKRAYAIGAQLGEKVLIISTSTGGTNALQLAANNYPQLIGLINFSPNIEVNDPNAWLLNDPWGLQIARVVIGDTCRQLDYDDEAEKYWNERYRLESLVGLQTLIETTMIKSTFEKVTVPVFSGFYYKNEEEQDPVIKVSAIREMHELLGTPQQLKVIHEFPTVGNHVLACGSRSEDIPAVKEAVYKFAEEVLSMKPTGTQN